MFKVTFGQPTWDEATQRPSYKVNILTSMPNTHTLTGSRYSYVMLTPIEARLPINNSLLISPPPVVLFPPLVSTIEFLSLGNLI